MSEIWPYICVPDSRAALEWYASTFGAVVTVDPIVMPDGRVGHAEMSVGGARVMMSDPHPELQVEPPAQGRGVAVTLYLTTDDVDEATQRAAAAGATVDRAPQDGGHGRTAVLRDPFGHRWMLGSPSS